MSATSHLVFRGHPGDYEVFSRETEQRLGRIWKAEAGWATQDVLRGSGLGSHRTMRDAALALWPAEDET